MRSCCAAHHVIERAIKKKDLTLLKTLEGSGDPAGQILSAFTVSRDKEAIGGATNILLLSFRGPVAADCTAILTAILESYQDYLDVTYGNSTDQTLAKIIDARNQLKEDLTKKEEALLDFRARPEVAELIRTKDGLNVLYDRIVELQKAKTQRSVMHEELKNSVDTLEKAVKDGTEKEALEALYRVDPKAPSSNKYLEEQLSPLLAQEAELAQKFGENHPDLMSLRIRIKTMRDQFEKLAGGSAKKERNPAQHYIKLLKDQMVLNELNLNAIDKLYHEATKKTQKLNTLEQEEDNLRLSVARSPRFVG